MSIIPPSKFSVGGAVFGFDAYDAEVATAAPVAYWKLDSITSPSATGYDAAVLGDGPEAYWPLGARADTVFVDVAGTYDLSSSSAGDWTRSDDALPNGDSAYSGDGTITATSNASGTAFDFADGTAWTFECWYWFSATKASAEVLMGCYPGGSSLPWAWRCVFDASEVLSFHIGNTANADYLTVSTATLSTNTWYHFVAVKQTGNDLRLYLNNVAGATDTTTTGTAQSPSGTYRTYLGTDGNAASDMISTGRLAKVAIYNRALSTTEIGEHYTAMTTVTNETTLDDSAATRDLDVPHFAAWTVHTADLPDDGNAMSYSSESGRAAVWAGTTFSLPTGSGSEARTFECIMRYPTGDAGAIAQVRMLTGTLLVQWQVSTGGATRWNTTTGTAYLTVGSVGQPESYFHFVAVFQCGATRRLDLYANGLSAGSDTTTSGSPATSDASHALELFPAGSRSAAKVARIAWYDRALGEPEIRQHYYALFSQ